MASVPSRVAIWIPPALRNRSDVRRILQACAVGVRTIGAKTEITSDPVPDCAWAITWGLGNPETLRKAEALINQGVKVIGWDLGYWHRSAPRPHYRLSINAVHPQALVMGVDRPPRPAAPKLRNDYDPNGHVLLVGMGRKSSDTYGEQLGQWERQQIQAIQKALPGRKIVFRPRPHGGLTELPGFEKVTGPIQEALRGASLAVCRHSNVAVDAIVAGIPAVADDGAAAAVCSHYVRSGLSPLPPEKARAFIDKLSWFQWAEDEMVKMETWGFIASQTDWV